MFYLLGRSGCSKLSLDVSQRPIKSSVGGIANCC